MLGSCVTKAGLASPLSPLENFGVYLFNSGGGGLVLGDAVHVGLGDAPGLEYFEVFFRYPVAGFQEGAPVARDDIAPKKHIGF